MILTFVSSVIICAICYGILEITMWHYKRRRLYEMASKFQGPRALPLIGNLHQIYGDSEPILSKLNKLVDSYPSSCRFWLGPKLVIVATDPHQIQAILLSRKTLAKSEMMDFGEPLFGTGILIAPVPIWKVHRKLIQPFFNQRMLDSRVKVFAAQSKILTDQIEQNLDGPEFDIHNSIFLCALDMICETTLGVRTGVQMGKNCFLVEAQEGINACFNERLFSPWMHPDFIFHRTKLARDQEKYVKYLHEFTQNVILMRRNQLPTHETQGGESTPRGKVLLDYLMGETYEKDKFSHKEVRDEVQTIVFAGSDTSASTNSFTLLMLASNPDVQEKVYEELYEIYGDDDVERRPVTVEDLPRMKCLERAIKETLRLFPIAPFIGRAVEEDLDIGGQTLPKGCSAVIGILGLHRNEKYWPNPLEFHPDRFLPEEIAKRHPYSYVAFSGGPRNCIGTSYAMMSMKTLLATFLRRYIVRKDDVVPVGEIRLKMEILMKPIEPIKIRIERRGGKRSGEKETILDFDSV